MKIMQFHRKFKLSSIVLALGLALLLAVPVSAIAQDPPAATPTGEGSGSVPPSGENAGTGAGAVPAGEGGTAGLTGGQIAGIVAGVVIIGGVAAAASGGGGGTTPAHTP